MTLRPFHHDDSQQVQEICSERDIAAFTRTIPHPYPPGAAAKWIGVLEDGWRTGKAAVYAMTDRKTGQVVGAVGLTIDAENESAELGYWVAKPMWGRGYATEGARAIVDFGFRHLGLNRIFAHHMLKNPASGRVMQKIGMRKEGVLREHVKKWGRFEDIAVYGVLSRDWIGGRLGEEAEDSQFSVESEKSDKDRPDVGE